MKKQSKLFINFSITYSKGLFLDWEPCILTLIRVHVPSEHSAERDGVEIEIITPDFLKLKRNVYLR